MISMVCAALVLVRCLTVVLQDPATATPRPDPRLGAMLRIDGGAGEGQCAERIALKGTTGVPSP
jgi:hypothetical protein